MKSILIAGQSFEVSTPYAAGHVLNEAEAKTLNQVRHENIRNNRAKAVKEAYESGDQAKIDEVRAQVTAYDNEYTFTIGGSGATSVRRDPVEREARSIAKDYIKAKLAEQGRTLKQVPEGMSQEEWDAKLEANIATVAESEAVLKMARKNVTDKSKRLESLAGQINLD